MMTPKKSPSPIIFSTNPLFLFFLFLLSITLLSTLQNKSTFIIGAFLLIENFNFYYYFCIIDLEFFLPFSATFFLPYFSIFSITILSISKILFLFINTTIILQNKSNLINRTDVFIKKLKKISLKISVLT